MDFKPLFAPTATHPISSQDRGRKDNTMFYGYIRNNFTIRTWLLLGALLQCLAAAILPLRYACLPPILIILCQTIDHALMQFGFTENRYMAGVITSKFSAQIPNADGTFGSTPAASSIIVFHLAARSNGPMGILDSDMAVMGSHITTMNAELEARASEYGFLGSSNWLNNSDRGTASETLNVMYFRDVEGLHKFAFDPVHRAGWEWWNQFTKDGKNHLGISHEVFSAPAGGWETVWMNYHPSLMAGTSHRVEMRKDGGSKGWGG